MNDRRRPTGRSGAPLRSSDLRYDTGRLQSKDRAHLIHPWQSLGATRTADPPGRPGKEEGRGAEPEARGPATASATRTLIYATAMPQARRRVAQALAARSGAGRGGRRDSAAVLAAEVRVDLTETFRIIATA